MRGETYFHQDQFHEALRDFLKVDILHDAPRWQAAALLEAGKVYERLDQWADAAETYERLLSKFPNRAQRRPRPGSASTPRPGGLPQKQAGRRVSSSFVDGKKLRFESMLRAECRCDHLLSRLEDGVSLSERRICATPARLHAKQRV